MTRTGPSGLPVQVQQGGEIDMAALSPQQLEGAAVEVGMAYCVADCDRARSRSAVLRAIAKAVDFPEYFGSDLDALFDCLCDSVLDQKTGMVLWLGNLHSGDPALKEDAERILAVCGDAAEFARKNQRAFSFVVQHAGKHPDPEPGVASPPYGEP